MLCPFCKSPDTKVVDSRAARDGLGIRRRRCCLQCDRRFSTTERLDVELTVVKRDGRSEPFDRSKLAASLRRALPRVPATPRRSIESSRGSKPNSPPAAPSRSVSTRIGDLALRALGEIDRLAYVRFATVYRRLSDWQELRAELEPMLAAPVEE